MAAPYWEYLPWVAAGIGACRYLTLKAPIAVIRLTAAFTHDEERHRQCMDVLELDRRDAPSGFMASSPPDEDTTMSLDKDSPKT
jgi:hypothetical protein